MKRIITKTADGSNTIFIPEWNENYHSKHGAIQEAMHVFIKMGLNHFLSQKQTINILEIGFGTGLNAFITAQIAYQNQVKINYTGVEAYPVTLAEVAELDYPKQLGFETYFPENCFQKIHESEWGKFVEINPFFQLRKQQLKFQEIENKNEFDLIYFDAFGPRVQPDLWGVKILQKMYNSLKSEGKLVTYSAKGSVRRNMQEVGFSIERLTGPPGKREMLRATKS
ncbi:tRNA (5-methylaminomethyl-2-thiouridine)(34)-methyltransferase MnmD [Mesonia sp. K7]|uniref:tRNA (5-methylaminomethyl-2-thiouridine)(34)-methyltransferase MnmD n=1 Tax=Mesonia sp. K7 TaxID=2218606 RepID=UPI000DA72ED1|nr:tRNA (5-methylaminomethyl-2-thiouridine)(34)-methyltransferase MnmD [Mesonia sp. K7]PZD79594.1 SAM-dependent methyltransferase [Mesonia sp. K7]